MSFNGQPDHDPQETREWLDALGSVLSAEGTDRAHFLVQRIQHLVLPVITRNSSSISGFTRNEVVFDPPWLASLTSIPSSV